MWNIQEIKIKKQKKFEVIIDVVYSVNVITKWIIKSQTLFNLTHVKNKSEILFLQKNYKRNTYWFGDKQQYEILIWPAIS